MSPDAVAPAVLYTFRRCPYAMRARLALVASGQHCEWREVVLRDKPAALLKASPKGTVPVLCLPDGRVLEQSLDIMHWALQRHDPLNWLAPWHEPHARGEAERWIAANDGAFKHDLDRYKYPNRYVGKNSADGAQNDAAEAISRFAVTHRTSAATWLTTLDAAIGPSGWILGSQRSLCDVAIAPFIRQFAATDAPWFDAQPWPHLHAWLAEFQTWPLLEAVMVRLPPWKSD